MLLGVHPALSGPLLALLDQMGHGDTVAVCDANFPAYRLGRQVVELPGLDAPAVVAAIRSVLPLDDGPAVQLMTAPTGVADDVQRELVDAAAAPARSVGTLERFEFYGAAAAASAVIRTGEGRPYGNVLLTKGVVGGDA